MVRTVLLVTACALGFDAAALTLVKDGTPESFILLAQRPTRSAQLAAKELQRHVELITGARLPVVQEGGTPPAGKTPLYVGEGMAAREMGLANDGFKRQEHLVDIGETRAVMIGRDQQDFGEISYEGNGGWPGINIRDPNFDVGTLYAVYDFLEKDCGVRWYMVTELGTVHPTQKTLEAKPSQRRTVPWMSYRAFSHAGAWAQPGTFGKPDVIFGYLMNAKLCSGRDSLLYTLRTRQSGASFNYRTHTLSFYNKRFAATRPEWFVDGSPGPNAQLRMGKDEVVNQVANDIAKAFRRAGAAADPEFQLVSGDVAILSPLDNTAFGLDCQPPLQPERSGHGYGKGIASNYWFSFVNRVAAEVGKECPGKWVASLAYENYFEPPQFPLADNVAVCVCNADGWTEGSHGLETLRDWSGKAKRLLTYEYWYSHGGFPAVRPRAVAAYIAKLRDMGFEGWNMETEADANPAVFHPDYYLTSRLLFERDAKADEILNEYYALFYGPAREPMRGFWTEMENDESLEAIRKLRLSDRNQLWYVIGLSGLIDRLGARLREAEKLAPQEPCASRVRAVRTGAYDMMRFMVATATKVVTTPIPEIEARKSDRKPVVDGKLDDAVWKDAATTCVFTHPHARKAATDDSAKIAWDGDNLYFGITLMEPHMDTMTLTQKSATDAISLDESVEVILDVGRRQPKTWDWLHVMINPNGLLWRCHWGRKGYPFARDMADLGIQGKAWRGPDRWTAEFAIQIAKLPYMDGKLPRDGDEWGLEIARNHRNDKFEFKCEDYEQYAKNVTQWSPTFSGGNMNSARFGVLRFKE